MKHTKNLIILQIIPQLKQGGVERGVLDIFRYLNKLNIENYIFCEGINGKFLSKNEKKNIFVTNGLRFKNLKNYFKLNKLLSQILEKKNINLVHVSSRAPALIFNITIKKTNKIRFITGFHNPYSSNFLKKFYNSFLLKGDLIICNSNFTKQHIINNYRIDKKKITSIPRGTDLEYFNPSLFGRKFIDKSRLSLNIARKDIVLAIPSRFSSWKGHFKLISFLNKIPESTLRALKLLIILDNPYKDKGKILFKCNKILKENVIFTEPTNNIREIYAISDMIISFSTKPEGFGRTISEALAMNKIAIGANNGGVREQLFNFDKKLLFELNNFNSFYKSFRYALSFIKSKNFKSRTYIKKKYSLKIMLDSTLEAYLLNEKK